MIRKITCRHFPHFWFQSSPQVEAIRTVGSVPKQKTQHFGQPRPHQGSAMQRSLTTGDLLTPGSKAQILMILVNYSFLYWNKNVLLFLPFFFFLVCFVLLCKRGTFSLCPCITWQSRKTSTEGDHRFPNSKSLKRRTRPPPAPSLCLTG